MEAPIHGLPAAIPVLGPHAGQQHERRGKRPARSFEHVAHAAAEAQPESATHSTLELGLAGPEDSEPGRQLDLRG